MTTACGVAESNTAEGEIMVTSGVRLPAEVHPPGGTPGSAERRAVHNLSKTEK